MRVAVFPGSFDPITVGHTNIIKRAAKLYDKIVVGILNNSGKSPAFSTSERKEMVELAVSDIVNVSCEVWDGMLVDFVKKHNACAVVKGIRSVSDFEYEYPIALLNKALNPDVETVFLTADEGLSFISSSMVKEVAKYHGKLEGFVPSCIIDMVMKKF